MRNYSLKIGPATLTTFACALTTTILSTVYGVDIPDFAIDGLWGLVLGLPVSRAQ